MPVQCLEKATSTSNNAKEVKFGMFESGPDGNHSDIGFVVTSTTFVMQDESFFGTIRLHWVYLASHSYFAMCPTYLFGNLWYTIYLRI